MKDIRDVQDYRILVNDTMNLAHQYQWAFRTLSYKDVPTGMLYGFVQGYFRDRKVHPMSRIIYLWEGSKSKRQSLMDAYKKSRREKPTEFEEGIRQVKEFFSYVDAESLSHIGLEADDLAGYISSRVGDSQYTLLTSNDRDWFQYLRRGVVDIRYGNTLRTYDDVLQDLGFPPERIGIYKVLKGDKSDEVRGIYGLPEKVALTLVKACSTYSEIQDVHLSKYDPKWLKWEKVIRDKWDEVIEFNAELVIFHQEWIEPSQIVSVKGQYDETKLVKFLEKYGMKKMLKEVTHGVR